MLEKIKNSIFLRPITFALIIAISSLSFTAPNGKVVLKAGTAIGLETTSTLNTANLGVGETVQFRISSDVVVNEKVVVKRGSLAQGQVVRASKAKGLGKEGFVEIQIKSLQTIDGQTMPLVGNNIYKEGESKQTTALLLGILVCVLFLTMKGENAIVPAGTSIVASAGMDLTVNTTNE